MYLLKWISKNPKFFKKFPTILPFFLGSKNAILEEGDYQGVQESWCSSNEKQTIQIVIKLISSLESFSI